MLRPININDSSVQIPDSIKQNMPQMSGTTPLPLEESTWVSSYYLDFKKRLLNLFGFEFRDLPCSLAF